jgi:uncharacterized spore protein YtfJ
MEQIEGAQSVVTSMLDRIKGTAHVEVVYGESRTVGDKTIIPVAVVAYGFGGGAGGGLAPSQNGERAASGGGGGGGGGVRVQPVAVLEVTDGDTRLVPVLDWTRILTTTITFLGLWMVIRAWRRR